jgi:hypothetical protein
MNMLEDRIRAAARAAAGTVAESSAPPLRLPQRGRVPRWPAWGNRRSLIAPLAAAAAVIAVVAGLILTVGRTTPGGTIPSVGPALAAPLPLTADGLPAYFLEYPITYQQGGAQPGTANEGSPPIPSRFRSHETLRIVATATGKVAATATMPGYVTAIAASRGAFFAAVVRDNLARFYEIRMTSSRAGTAVTELPIAPDTAPVESMAASPNGAKLAYSTLVSRGASGDVQNLVVASTTDDSEREWSTPAHYSTGSMGPMNFLADGRTLAFSWTGSSEAPSSSFSSLRLLDTVAPGSDLMAGRAVLRFVPEVGVVEGYTLSPNGRIAVGVASRSPGPTVVDSVVVSSAGKGDRRLLYRLWASGGAVNSCNTPPLWISNTGSQVLIECYATASSDVRIVLVNHGHATQLPWLDATANEITAFPGITAIGVPANADG